MKRLLSKLVLAVSCVIISVTWSLSAHGRQAGLSQPSSDMLARVQGSVVNIQTDRLYRFRYRSTPDFVEQFAHDFFEEEREVEVKIPCRSEGSGVITDPSGLVLTNAHVIAEAEHIRVVLANKKTYTASLLGKNTKEDVALLRLDATEMFPVIVWGDSNLVKAGEDVFAIGNPFGYEGSITKGIVSATNRQLKGSDGKVLFDSLIQTDAAVHPGNSGGPLLNANGEMIGIIQARDWRAQRIGFAIPANKVKQLLPELAQGDRVDARLLQFRERFGFLPKELGGSDGEQRVVIETMLPRSQAALAGLQPGDTVRKFQHAAIQDMESLLEAASAVQGGQRTYLECTRGRQTFFTYLRAPQ